MLLDVLLSACLPVCLSACLPVFVFLSLTPDRTPTSHSTHPTLPLPLPPSPFVLILIVSGFFGAGFNDPVSLEGQSQLLKARRQEAASDLSV